MIKKEIIIVGYGPAAMTAAVILGKQGMRVLIVNSFAGHQKSTGATKLLALSLSSTDLFEEHGLVANISDIGQSINKIQVIQYRKSGVLEFDPQSIGQQDFGYMVSEDDLWQSLNNDVRNTSNIEIVDGQVSSIDYKKNKLILQLADGHSVASELLVVADGKNSIIRKKLNFEVERRSYNQVALVCDIKHTRNHQGIARELFMKNGPFAILPKVGGFTSSVVWTESCNSVKFLKSIDERLLQELVAARCPEELGDIQLSSKPSIFPLTLTVAKEAVAERIALVGDAWHSIHPLAGQGLNLGLRDIRVLTDFVIQEKNLGLDIGNAQILKKYQRIRKDDVAILIGSMDIINSIYRSRLPLIPEIGQLMLRFINSFSPLKNLFMIYATGKHV